MEPNDDANLSDFDRVIKDLRTKVLGKQAHARGCKKAPDECKVCVSNVRFFSDLPASTLSRVLAE